MPRSRRARGATPLKSIRTAVRHAAIAAVDALEPRRLLASVLDDGELRVVGTNGPDTIVLNVRNGNLQVFLNGSLDGSFELDGDDDDDEIDEIRISGLDGNDHITVESGIDDTQINGNDGDDTLIGGDGDDTIDGDDGNDTTDGKGGSDLLIGGNGFDAADYRFETADLRLSIDGDNDERGGNADGDNISLSIERIVGGSGNDFITGSDASNSLSGRDGNDTISGQGGDDSVNGDDGDDRAGRRRRRRRAHRRPGNDTMGGDEGNDAFVTNDGQADTLFGGNGDDTAVADQPGDSFSSIEGGHQPPRARGAGGRQRQQRHR